MADYNLKAEITADASGYEAGVKKAEKASKKLSTTISGVVKGNINTDELTALKSTSKVEVDLTTKQLLIEVGAQFTGKCVMGQQSTVAMPKQKIG
jgi:cytoskeletal protein CcmA (bactofilin family)